MRNVRLALLLCDEIITMAGFSNYARIFERFLSSSLKLINSEVTFILDAYDVVEDMAYPPNDVHYDGILISGSRTSVIGDLEWVKKLVAYIKHIASDKPTLKLFGICFGHQIIATALGSDVEKGDWEVSVTNVYLSRIGKAIFHTDRLSLQLVHHDQVVACPPHAHLLGVSEDVRNQGFVIFHGDEAPLSENDKPDALLRSIRVFTLQGHPELTKRVMVKLIRESAEELGPELVADALSRVGLPADGIDKVGRVVWGVLGVTLHC